MSWTRFVASPFALPTYVILAPSARLTPTRIWPLSRKVASRTPSDRAGEAVATPSRRTAAAVSAVADVARMARAPFEGDLGSILVVAPHTGLMPRSRASDARLRARAGAGCRPG